MKFIAAKTRDVDAIAGRGSIGIIPAELDDKMFCPG